MKQLKYLLLILPFLFIGSVKAESVEFDYSFSSGYFNVENYSEFETFLNDNADIITSLYEYTFEKYNSDYSISFPYYLIQLLYQNNSLEFALLATDSPLYLKPGLNGTFLEDGEVLNQGSSRCVVLSSSYSFEDNMYITNPVGNFFNTPSHYAFQGSYFYEVFFMDSNYDLKIYTDYDNIIIHNYRDINSDYIINSGDTYPTYYKNGISTNKQLVEVNLNDYAYVALSLKDYNQNSFSSQVYAKGNYCITPVYNYGMTERNEILSGTKVERCSPYYETYTPIRTYITDSDLNNNAIYYLKAYDTSKDNYVKIDTSIFDITYVTEENKYDPYVMINGKSYPTIPYDSLTDTATKSEDEGYVSGAVEEFSFSDIFTAPLEALKDIWQAVISFFAMITEFLALLPAPLQGFLFTSFTLAIVLGLIKILL